MKKPVIVCLDDDTSVLKSITRDVKSHYKSDYRIISSDSAGETLTFLKELKTKGEEVALFLSDQRMPEMLGVEFLEEAKDIFPNAKRILLTAYSDTEAAIKAINEVQLDFYLLKPWNPPEEKLYPVLDDQLEEWQANYKPAFEGIKIIGYQWSPKSHEIKDFLAGNLIPYLWLDIEKEKDAQDLQKMNSWQVQDLPVVLLPTSEALKNPTIADLGDKIGMKVSATQEMYDVAIIGAGPAGLASGVYGGSEGLNTILIEKRAPGGQAGTSSRIENYLGFPNGLSGADLSRRAISQATRFGIEFLSPQEVVAIDIKDQYKIIKLKDGSSINARSVIITAGVDYRKHPAKGIDQFTGAGIYYGAATTEAFACKNEEIYIVGGGNSAGQAAMYLSKFAKNVNIVVRKPDLSASMSSYLIDQITETENITLLGNSEIVEVKGDDHLQSVVLQDNIKQTKEERDAAALFIFIGAKPMTEWLNLELIKDQKGFLETGPALTRHESFKKIWKIDREPFLLETCIPGVFAAGDVRSGAMNRVASAVGEGSMAIKFVHEYLAET
ncbi:MAG: FAD-dependent oxidoreductase [Bacteroidota bacterium]